MQDQKVSKPRSIVLLSGGMDSVTALFWALKETDVIFAVHFSYNQRGARYEKSAVHDVMSYVNAASYDGESRHVSIMIPPPINIFADSALTIHDDTLAPDAKRPNGLPRTFVPARNLIFIAHATAIAYEIEADMIIGGWNSVDVDYPDCKLKFLHLAGRTATLAIGRGIDDYTGIPDLRVFSPVQMLTKVEVVRMGELLNVPWHLTRSCYADTKEPCMKCDSCLKRIHAFIDAGVRDPIVPDNLWIDEV